MLPGYETFQIIHPIHFIPFHCLIVAELAIKFSACNGTNSIITVFIYLSLYLSIYLSMYLSMTLQPLWTLAAFSVS
jgi:hypothetical protein